MNEANLKLLAQYIHTIEKELAVGNATEHTHRPALKTLVEGLAKGVTATNEPKRIECGAPDFLVTKGTLTVGYIEAKDVGQSLDEAESGKTTARPAFREMIAMARRSTRPFDLILVWKYSRFARNRQDSIIFKTMLRKAGVQVISITEPFEDTPTGRLLEDMIESLDEFYSANLGEEITRGMRESASRGFYVGGYTPYGYRRVKVKDGSKDRVKLEPDTHQAAIVERLFNEVLSGKGLKELGKELRRDGIASPTGKGWGKTSLYHILTNVAYTGTLVWGRNPREHKAKPIRLENAWLPIVTMETFEHVQKLLRDRAPARRHPRRTSSRYLLSGLARCGHCGKALTGQDAKGGKFSYYVCGTLLKKGAGTCKAHYLNAPKFENLVIDKIKQRILTRENLRKLELSDLTPRIQVLRQRQDQLQSAKEELSDKFADRKVELADLKLVENYANDLRNLLSQSSLAKQKVFIRSFVKEIRVTDREVDLFYTIPLPHDGTVHDRAEVPSIVQLGSAYRIRTGDLLLEREVS